MCFVIFRGPNGHLLVPNDLLFRRGSSVPSAGREVTEGTSRVRTFEKTTVPVADCRSSEPAV